MSHTQAATIFCIIATLLILSGRVNADVREDIHNRVNAGYVETTNLCWYTAHDKRVEFFKAGFECKVLIIKKRFQRRYSNITHAVTYCKDNGLVYDDNQKVFPNKIMSINWVKKHYFTEEDGE